MKTQELTLSIGRRPVTMRLIEWEDGGSALTIVGDDQQTPKREGKAECLPPALCAAHSVRCDDLLLWRDEDFLQDANGAFLIISPVGERRERVLIQLSPPASIEIED
jgi:hypothetical protein